MTGACDRRLWSVSSRLQPWTGPLAPGLCVKYLRVTSKVWTEEKVREVKNISRSEYYSFTATGVFRP